MRRRSTLGLAFLLAVSSIVITAGPAFAAGDITGTVTSELGQAIPGICVEAHDSTAEGTIIGFDRTADDGTYTIAAIADGDYKLFFYDDDPPCGDQYESHIPEVTAEWHNNVADFASATVVSIAGGDQVVDAVLTGLGVVEGTLSGGTDLSCMTANLYDTTDFTTVLATQSVDSDNTYSLTGLIITPVYTFQFVSNDAGDCEGLASEWHGDIPVRLTDLSAFGDLAATFSVGAGATVTIDPTLTERGTVSGMMISERTGAPIDGAPVRLYPLDRSNNVGDDWIQVNTTADGTFVVDDSDALLVAGNYKLEAPGFTDAGGLTWDGEWWEDAAQGTATELFVAVGADIVLTGPIDRHGPGALTGTVTEDGSGVPVEGVTVTLYEAGGTMFVASETTDASGDYDFGEVNRGTFDLEFSAAGYDTEWFDGAADAASGSIVIADSNETSSPVTTADAALVPGTASISGTVTTDDVSAVPVSDVTVTLYTEAGSKVDDTTTAADGTYTFGTVGSGDYDLEFTATGYGTEWFDNAASAAAGSLTVGSGQAKIANAALLPGSISGTITDDSGPVSGVTVEAYVGGAVIGSATSAADGTYKISGLVGDTYTVLANTGPAANPDTHFSAWHVFAPLFLTDDATDVVVGTG